LFLVLANKKVLLGNKIKRLGNNKELAEESKFLKGKIFSIVPRGLPKVLLYYC